MKLKKIKSKQLPQVSDFMTAKTSRYLHYKTERNEHTGTHQL